MTKEEREELARLEREATPGPWLVKVINVGGCGFVDGYGFAKRVYPSVRLGDGDSIHWTERDYDDPL